MSTKAAYLQKIEAEIELTQAKIEAIKAQTNSALADERIKYEKEITAIESGIESTKAKLKELGEASDDTWDHLKSGIETAWTSASHSIHEAYAKLKS
jgi:septal ring factor EnvC (AmiA/AmiB activator)